MKIVPQKVEILSITAMPLELIEECGRTCYQSHDRITPGSEKRFAKMLINRGHESVLEHANVTARFITDRAIANELTRHRHTSPSQESTRYVRYGDIEVVEPFPEADNPHAYHEWKMLCYSAETVYKNMLDLGATPEQARDVLPLSTKTEVVVTANIREWRHILRLRTSPAAHPKMRELMNMLLTQFMIYVPELFEDIKNV